MLTYLKIHQWYLWHIVKIFENYVIITSFFFIFENWYAIWHIEYKMEKIQHRDSYYITFMWHFWFRVYYMFTWNPLNIAMRYKLLMALYRQGNTNSVSITQPGTNIVSGLSILPCFLHPSGGAFNNTINW